jgi:hypothetical protein
VCIANSVSHVIRWAQAQCSCSVLQPAYTVAKIGFRIDLHTVPGP